ncbi:MAG: aminopeptidase [Limisphaerales bacterium]
MRLVIMVPFCLFALVCFSGCQAMSFYGQAIAGQCQILAHQESIAKLMADPATSPELKAKFAQVLKIRRFAKEELKLPADSSYLKYTDLHRPCAVWNVTVAPALSLEPMTWWFPVVGRADYRGYFNEAAARRYAARWEKKGWDVDVGGVTAYSTLGWFRDPLLNTFIFEPEADLAELIFHELGHRRLYVNGDTDFNEAFATEVAAEGLRRWFAASTNAAACAAHEAAQARDRQFVRLVMDTRGELETVYGDAHLTGAEKLRRKEEIIAKLSVNYTVAKKTWGGATDYDGWFAKPINNAKLNTISEYYDLVPAFQALLLAQGGDMGKFYVAVAALGKLPLEQRHAALRQYLKGR